MSSAPAVDTRNLRAFNQALWEYSKFNKTGLGPMLESRATKMRWELYKLYRSISPTREKLDTELDALGYRMKRRVMASGRRLTWAEEKRKRRSSLKYLSVGFLLKDWRAAKEGQNIKIDQRNRINSRIGQVIDRTARGVIHPSVELINMLEGAVKMNVERGLVNKAIASQTADMQVYIQRKQKEAQARTIAKINAFTKGLAA
jgi:hypothetical protein